jgi:ethanolamine utilization protein EutQ (cupin superfamily)
MNTDPIEVTNGTHDDLVYARLMAYNEQTMPWELFRHTCAMIVAGRLSYEIEGNDKIRQEIIDAADERLLEAKRVQMELCADLKRVMRKS